MHRILLALEWYDHRIHRGVARVAARCGWHLDCPSGQPGFDPVPRGWRGDGAITLLSDRWMRRLRRRNIPLVDFGLSTRVGVPRIVVDNGAAAALAYAHLRERGWRRFACLTLPGSRMYAERAEAFTARCNAEGFACPHWSTSDLRRHLPQAAPLAVFAVQDALGAEAIATTLDAGLRVPDEVAVLGVDDCDLICESLTVPLASVDTDQEGLGEAVAQRLALMLAGAADTGDLRRHPPRGVVSRASAEAFGTDHPGLRAALALARREPACGVRALARAAHLSPQCLDRICRRDLGLNPGTLLRRLRIAEGLRLQAEGWALRRIADHLGVASTSGLCALLRRHGRGGPVSPASGRRSRARAPAR